MDKLFDVVKGKHLNKWEEKGEDFEEQEGLLEDEEEDEEKDEEKEPEEKKEKIQTSLNRRIRREKEPPKTPKENRNHPHKASPVRLERNTYLPVPDDTRCADFLRVAAQPHLLQSDLLHSGTSYHVRQVRLHGDLALVPDG